MKLTDAERRVVRAVLREFEGTFQSNCGALRECHSFLRNGDEQVDSRRSGPETAVEITDNERRSRTGHWSCCEQSHTPEHVNRVSGRRACRDRALAQSLGGCAPGIAASGSGGHWRIVAPPETGL
jgi:hypothetical protein